MKYKIRIKYYDGGYIQDFYVVVNHSNGWVSEPVVKITKLEAEG